MARRRREEEEPQGLNLAPIMNMVMILIPLLLLSTVFMKTGVVNISSPRNAQAQQQDTEEREEEVPVPRVVVFISQDGFRIGDQRNLPEFQQNFTAPISRCGGGGAVEAAVSPHDMAQIPATVCLRDGVDANAPLVEKLDFAGLYNRLVEIRLHTPWFVKFAEENNSVVSILGDPEVPFEVLVKTMDTARFLLAGEGGASEAPTVGASSQAYLLGGGDPSMEHFENATYIQGETGPFPLFPDPVLLLPRPGSGG